MEGSTATSTRTFLSAAAVRRIAFTSPISSGRSIGSGRKSSFPDSTLARSSTSLIRRSRWRLLVRTLPRNSRCSAVSGPTSPSWRSWVKPRMALSGVRSSCDMFARNCDLYAPALVSSAAPRHVERDGERLAHGSEQLGGTLRPGLQADELEDAGDLADAEQRNQRDRAWRPVGQARADPKLAGRGMHDHDLALERGLADEALAGAEAQGPVAGRDRVLSQHAKDAVRVRGVEGSHRAIERAAEGSDGAVRHFLRLQLSAELVRQGRLHALQPIDVAPLGFELLEAVRHLVRLPGQLAQLVAAHHRDGGAEVALAEAAEPGCEVGHALQHFAADPERQQEHHHQARDAETQAHAGAGPLGFRRRGERVGQLRLVERRGLVEELRHPGPLPLQLPDLRDDSLAGL